MIKSRWIIFLSVLAIFILSFVILFGNVFNIDSPKDIIDISVISGGESVDSLSTIKQGIDQAASDMKVDISFITLNKENDLVEQIALINREIDSGVDAILLSAVDSQGLIDCIESIESNIPIITIDSTVDTPKVLAYYSADNYNIGLDLGKHIASLGKINKNIAIITTGSKRSNIKQRYVGLEDSLGSNNNIFFWSFQTDKEKSVDYISKLVIDNKIDSLVTIDLSSLELAIKLKKQLKDIDVDIFGIGNNTNIVSALEKNIINSIVVQNDFSIGYLAVEAAISALDKKSINKDINIEYRIITSNNMYEPKNQKMLFPIVR